MPRITRPQSLPPCRRGCTGWCGRCCPGNGSGRRSCCCGWRIRSYATSGRAAPTRDAAPPAVKAGWSHHLKRVVVVLEPLSLIIDEFNKRWGSFFSDPEQAAELIKAMPEKVSKDTAYQNAKMYSDRQNAQVEHDAALKRQVVAILRCNTEFYKKYTEDADFQEWLNNEIFRETYEK